MKLLLVPRRLKKRRKSGPTIGCVRLPAWARHNAPLRELHLHTESFSRRKLNDRMFCSLIEAFFKAGSGAILAPRSAAYSRALRGPARLCY
jgi:hypothetical protein